MSPSPYSFARAFVGVMARCTPSVNFSALLKIEGNQVPWDRLSQPGRAMRLTAPNVPFRNCLRSITRSYFMALSFMLMLHDEPPSHHRANIVIEPGQDHFRYMNHDKSDE